MKKLLLTISASLLALCQLAARPVHNKPVTLVQPDGSTISAIINGDEFHRSTKDLQGHNLVQGPDGTWCFASFSPDGRKVSSGYSASGKAPSGILSASMSAPLLRLARNDRRAQMESRMDADGSIIRRIMASSNPVRKHCMILLVDFKDKKMTFTKADFEKLVKQKGYSLYGASGSVNDYFNDQFKGDVEFSYEISDVITLDRDCAYYFANTEDGEDIRPDYAVAEACQKAAAAGIDFSQCDDDGDGQVDNVFLFVAGKDEADGGGEDCVWSHMHYLEFSEDPHIRNLVINGVRINNYAISTEYRQTDDRQFTFTAIGTFCHEYSHALGLKDLYDTDYAGSGGYGNGLWFSTGLMDGGNQNNEYNTPPHYNAIDYYLSGIGNPEDLRAGTYTLEPISENRRFLKLETGNAGEYYLIECRSDKGWDRYIGGKGLLIYHIDRSRNAAGRSDRYDMHMNAITRWSYNEVNCVPDRQCAALVPATAGIKAYTSDGYLMWNTEKVFFPSKSNDAFTPLTDPAFIFWDGTASPLAITSIAMDGEKVTFKVSKAESIRVPEVVLARNEIFQDAAIIQWTADDPEYVGNAYVSWGQSDGSMTEIEVAPYENGRYALVLDALEPMTAYRTTISFKEMGLSSKEAQVNFTTKRMYDGYPFIFLNNVSRNEDGSFEQGTMVPLRLYNAKGAASVEWYMGNNKISVGGDGYYHISSSGRLKAVVTLEDGTKEVLMKEVKVK